MRFGERTGFQCVLFGILIKALSEIRSPQRFRAVRYKRAPFRWFYLVSGAWRVGRSLSGRDCKGPEYRLACDLSALDNSEA